MTALPKGKVRPARDVIYRELGGEMVLLNLQNGVYYGLNETGVQMWTLLAELKDPRRVLDALEQEYAASRAQLEQDLNALLAELSKKGLIEVDE
ncbi:MAG TPA: PqqD family protein [Candidatus Xenobia bacterium]|nr:PqqD family protein [Candidatus Xenobia bacterium]